MTPSPPRLDAHEVASPSPAGDASRNGSSSVPPLKGGQGRDAEDMILATRCLVNGWLFLFVAYVAFILGVLAGRGVATP